MKFRSLGVALGILVAVGTLAAGAEAKEKGSKKAWSMNASVIEACSCPMFCQCYFNTKPAAHGEQAETAGQDHAEAGHDHGGGGEHFCRFNNAYKVNKGHHGDVKLDGAMFWIAGDLGGDFSHGQMDWAVVTFDKATTPEQRKAIGEICGALFPVKWNSMTTSEGAMEWTHKGDIAYATLDGGKTAEVRLDASNLMRDDKATPMVLKNLKYWGATSNDGFVMMPNVIEAYRAGDKQYEFKNTNGFMITFDIEPPASGGGH